ncbi:hypothetical protein VE03_09276 [Pseudogymnoascus sp. 23342-1-I1]|nr:hypothetical protein VE03_09276 [Pseudogymnoascus sp. 23342-1-I1]
MSSTLISSIPGRHVAADKESDYLLQLEPFDIPSSRLVHGHAFPLGLRPTASRENPSIAEATAHIRELADQGIIQSLLTKHGVILFRGLPIADAAGFSAFTESFKFPRHYQEIGLAGKRSVVAGNVKTANEEPPDVKFYYHTEYGRSANYPDVLFFYSEIVPEQGGQTPLLSSVELCDRLEKDLPQFYHDLTTKGVIGRQYFPAPNTDEAKTIGWNWKDSYGFDIQPGDSLEVQHSKVAAVLASKLQAKAEWQANGALHVLQQLPAIRRVKSTNTPTFFNGFAGVYGRARDNGALNPPYRGTDGGIHLPTTYGDGSEIPIEYLERLLEIQDEIGFLTPWQPGDVALIDNHTAQHARTPWVGKRSLLVSLWEGNERLGEI